MLSLEVEEAAVDNCPERMDVVDTEAPRPPRIETAVEFWSGMKVQAMMGVESTRFLPMMGRLLSVRRGFCCCTRKNRNKKQELKAAG